MKERISKALIRIGLGTGKIEIIDHLKFGTVCLIGESWFYFAGMQGETENAEAIIENTPTEVLVDEIYSAINETDEEDCKYYLSVLCPEYQVKDSDIEGYPTYISGDYVISPCRNIFNKKISYWISKKGYMKACYAFTACTVSDTALDALDVDAYIQAFKVIIEGEKNET